MSATRTRTPDELRAIAEFAERDNRDPLMAIYEAGRLDASPSRKPPQRYRSLLDRRLPVHLRQRSIRILSAVASLNGINVEALLAKSWKGSGEGGRPISEAMWCLRRTGMSFPAIAIACKRADHTTAMGGCRRVEARFVVEVGLRESLQGIVAAGMDGEEEADVGTRTLRSVA
jgi:hypothetical protein